MIKQYFSKIESILDEALATQEDKIEIAAQKVAQAVERHSNIYAFGCNHAGLLAQELIYRTGGLAVINPLVAPGLTINIRPITLTTGMERLQEYGRLIVDESGVKADDVLIVHSVSGRNAVSVDVAIRARELGAYVICLTNMKYSKSVPSRHASHKKLFEVCDLVIDNCGDIGDAAMAVKGMNSKVASSSTVVGATILNAMMAEAINIIVTDGFTPPVFASSNIEGGDAINRDVLNKYHENIKYM